MPVYSDTTQLNSTRQHEQQLIQFVGRDVINKNTTDLAVRCSTGWVEFSWVQLSWVELCRYKHPLTNSVKSRDVKSAFNPSNSKGNYSATSNNTKLVHWPLMGGLLHLAQRGGAWRAAAPKSSPRCTKCNSPPISVPITVLLYDGPLLCGFNVAIKGLITCTSTSVYISLHIY